MKRLAILSVTIILLIFSTKAQEIKDINEYLYTIDKSIPSYLTFADKGNIKKQRINIKDKGVALKKILKLNDETTTELIDTLTDVVGGFHEVYREYYKNIEIEGSRCIIHYDKDGNAINLNGNFRTINNLEISPQLNEAKALSYALKHIGAVEYAWEDKEKETLIKKLKNDSSTTHYPKGSLVVYVKDNKAYLVYKFFINTISPRQHLLTYVDANTGLILDKYSVSCNVSTNVITRYSGTRQIETQHLSSFYILRDYTRGNGIETYNSIGNDYTSNDNTWGNLSINDRAALDVHWGLETTYDFYSNKFGRNSYDNNGGLIISYVNEPNWGNASWIPNSHMMHFGIQNNIPWTSLDIVAHELTHGVTEMTSNLIYFGESGAINEGMSDAFAVCVEKETKPSNGNNIWIIGEDIWVGGIRDIRYSVCKYYKGLGWVYEGDNGGVHTNSGVFNYWFYLLSCGGNGTNQAGYSYSLNGIGLDKTIQICYLMNASYLTPNSTFADARVCSILAAQALGYDSYTIRKIQEAWHIVGVGEAPPLYISAPSAICTTATAQILDFPTDCTVNWSVSNSCLQIISGQGTDSVTLQRNDDGWATLTATISHNGTVVKTLSKEIMVGTPAFCMSVIPVAADGSQGYWRSDLNGNSIDVEFVNSNARYPNYVVDLYRIDNGFSVGTHLGHWVTPSLSGMTFNYYPQGWYYIEVVGVNDCGTSEAWGTELECVDGNDLQNRMFSFVYDQSSAMLTVTLNPASARSQGLSRNQSLSGSASAGSYEVLLWNENTLLRSYKATDAQLQIPMSGMKSGLYVVCAVKDGKTQQRKLIKE